MTQYACVILDAGEVYGTLILAYLGTISFLNTLRTGSLKLFKLFKRPFPGFLTILTL